MVTIEKIIYAGWANSYRVSNSRIELVCIADIGPRIIFFGFNGQENQFYEKPSEMGKSGGDEWRLYGGHRLWHAPEIPARTYFPDNNPVAVETLNDGVLLIAPVESSTGIQKSIEIHLSPDKPMVMIHHTLKNAGPWTVPIAPWALTVLRPGGVAILPHPERCLWPESLLPSHTVSLWGYTRMSDPRWVWGDKYILLRQSSEESHPQKIGMFNTTGWAAYARGGSVFIKKFDVGAHTQYPDQNSNLESWTNQDLLELETLGPLELLEPGNNLLHRETWYLAENIPLPKNDADVDQNILSVVGQF
jgi:hypothetical protein